MSDQQGWTAPGASTPPGDASGDATGDASGDATAARADASHDTSGDAAHDALGEASDGVASDPTSDPGWGPPSGAAPTVPVPQPDASAYPPPAWWGQQPPTGPARTPASDAGHPAPAGAYPPPGGIGSPPPAGAYPPPSSTPLPQASGPGRPTPVQPPGWVPPQLAPKPGIIPLRPLNLGEIWSGVMTAVRGNPAATIGLALVTTAVVLVPLTLIGVWIASTVTTRTASLDASFDGYGDSAGSTSAFLGGTLASLVPGLAMYVTALLLPLFMAVVIGQGVQGRRIGLGETARAARGRILPALGVVLLVGLAATLAVGVLVGIVVAAWVGSGDGGGGAAALVTFLAVAVFIVLALLFGVRWGFALTIVVLEGAGPTLALRRSWTLTRKRGFWRIFGIRLLTGIVAAIAGSVITAPLGFLVGVLISDSSGSTAWVLVLVQAGTVLVQSVLTTPFTAGVDSLLYVDQRIRYEGLDVALLQQSQQGRDAQVP